MDANGQKGDRKMRAIDADGFKEKLKDRADKLYANIANGATYPSQGWFDGLSYAQCVVDGMPTVDAGPKWIPCSERMPKQGQEVICQCRARIIQVLKLDANGDWYKDANHCYMSGFVIAWIPLPKPYEVEHGID